MVSFIQVSVSGHLRCQWQPQGILPTAGHHSGCVRLIYCSPAPHGALLASRLCFRKHSRESHWPRTQRAPLRRVCRSVTRIIRRWALRPSRYEMRWLETPSRNAELSVTRRKNRGLARERATARLRHWRCASALRRLPAQCRGAPATWCMCVATAPCLWRARGSLQTTERGSLAACTARWRRSRVYSSDEGRRRPRWFAGATATWCNVIERSGWQGARAQKSPRSPLRRCCTS